MIKLPGQTKAVKQSVTQFVTIIALNLVKFGHTQSCNKARAFVQQTFLRTYLLDEDKVIEQVCGQAVFQVPNFRLRAQVRPLTDHRSIRGYSRGCPAGLIL